LKHFKFISCIGLLAIMCMVAMPPGALASEGLNGITGDGGSVLFKPNGGDVWPIDGDISPYDGDIVAYIPTWKAGGMHTGFAAVTIEFDLITSGTAALMIGGGSANNPYSKPRSFT